VRAASFELAMDPGFKPGASSGSATPANWCPLIDSNDHDRSRRDLKPLSSTDSAKRALVRAEGVEPPRCYPPHSECGASAGFATRALSWGPRSDLNQAQRLTGAPHHRNASRANGAGRVQRRPRCAADRCRQKSSAETRALEPERPTGRRGALCTRAPSWTFISILADRNSCRPQSGQPTARAACRKAATGAMTLRSRLRWLVGWRSSGPFGPPLVAEANGLRGLFWS
jgi:hypothetical protein